MTIAETFLTEFEQETPTTRKFLERLPGDKLAWKPHEKSMSAGQLALHIAKSPGQVAQMALVDEAPPPDFKTPVPAPQSVAEILQALDDSVAKVRSVLSQLSDGQMNAPWRMAFNGQVLLSMPRAALIRSILLNHVYHHRGQFGVYLRLLGAKVPSSYGPSGDEAPSFLP
ncbi:MAG: DinB family protein [Planctomycetaceae bacterium]|nr:DinB family protein [Planctomycetaceae bacterium]